MSGDAQVLQEELNQVKSQVSILEKEKSEISQSYDKDKVLWESERTFQEERINKAKLELQDNQKKFEDAINQLQKKPTDNKNTANHHEIYAQAQAECQAQIHELKKNHETLVDELKQKCHSVEKNYKDLQEKHEIAIRDAQSDKSSYEK